MTNPSQQQLDRVLLHAPTANDSAVARDVLREAGIAVTVCDSVATLCDFIVEGCAALVIAQEAITAESEPRLQRALSHQESWSDLPVVLLAGNGAQRIFRLFSSSGNISILERPFARADLINAVEVAIRARQRQYRAKRVLEEQKNAAVKRDEFLATLSHELRTPLNVILGWTEILLSGELSPEAQIDALKILDRNAKLQKSLIDDLLDTSRIISGKLYLEMKPVSLTRILESIHQELLPRTKEKGVEFKLHVLNSDALVIADESRLSQVFTNLITNAIKFTPAGGSISMRIERRKAAYEVLVSDTGQGMDPEFVPRVFDRFKQEDMSTKRVHGGLGLGLSIAAHIVAEHKGSIRASSPGHNLGSQFSVVLPAIDHSPVELSSSSSAALAKPEALRGARILVVDDSADIRQLIELWLQKAKGEVKTVATGEDALQTLRTFRPHLLLSDIGMPNMDGYELISRIRTLEDPELRKIPAGALTAYAKDEERARVLEAGFQTHISKPISNADLIAAVLTLLQSKVDI